MAMLAMALASATTEPPDSTADVAPPPSPAEACNDPDLEGHGLWLEGAEGARFQAAVVGDGPNVAIFLHQIDGSYCGFTGYVSWLTADADVRAVLVNLCGKGETECPRDMTSATSGNVAVAAAADWATSDGAARVALVGASFGGTQVLVAAASPDVNDHVDAVVSLSGPPAFRGLDAEAAAPDVAVPVLLAGSGSDVRPTEEDLERIAGLLGTDDVEVRFFEDGGHGWDLLRPNEVEGVDTEFRMLVRDWISGAQPARGTDTTG